MSNADFTDAPSNNDYFVQNIKVFRYSSPKWRLTKFRAADDGVIDAGGVVGSPKIILSMGVHSSDFAGLDSFDCGGV